MTPQEKIFELCSLASDEPTALLVAQDRALELGWRLDFITDEEAEFERVRAAVGAEVELPIIDRIPRPKRPVRCGGLRAVEPSVGGDLKAWVAARVARLWSRRPRLFEYIAKRDGQPTRRRQRWETRDYVDIGEGNFSPAHLSGFASYKPTKTFRGVRAPRKTPPAAPPMHLRNHEMDFGGGK